MKVILVSGRYRRTWAREFSARQMALLSVCLLGVSFIAGGLSMHRLLAVGADPQPGSMARLNQDTLQAWQAALDTQAAQLAALRSTSQAELATLARRTAELHARLLRLDALGERISVMARLDQGEFDFGSLPALGGPEAELLPDTRESPLSRELDRLTAALDSREQQLDILSNLLVGQRLYQEEFPAGRPVTGGWLSSRFGHRTDPFNGRRAWHGGVDFAGRAGADIIAVAAGVVTLAGELPGYGRLVEINHGNGYSTRYAHNQENRVAVGDIVRKGQVVALMGSSGRSTGPHVHFEVYKHGRLVDPASYIARTLR